MEITEEMIESALAARGVKGGAKVADFFPHHEASMVTETVGWVMMRAALRAAFAEINIRPAFDEFETRIINNRWVRRDVPEKSAHNAGLNGALLEYRDMLADRQVCPTPEIVHRQARALIAAEDQIKHEAGVSRKYAEELGRALGEITRLRAQITVLQSGGTLAEPPA